VHVRGRGGMGLVVQPRHGPRVYPQDDGFIFLWVTMRALELARDCLDLWGYGCDAVNARDETRPMSMSRLGGRSRFGAGTGGLTS
jgi:N6-adenosine-specific RNA methylase IME4